MNSFLFIAILITFTMLYFILGVVASGKVQSTTDYFLAGRKLSFSAVTFTLIATQLGGGMLLGTSQEAYTIGLWGILYTLGISIGFLLLACGIAARLQSLDVETTAQLFQTRYNSLLLKKIASFLSILTLCGLFIGQIVASRTIVAGLGFSTDWAFSLFWLFIIISAAIGGLYAVAETDRYQVCYIMVVFISIFAYAIWQTPTSLSSLVSTAGLSMPSLDFSSMFGILVMPALFSLIEQDLAQRFFAARSGRVAVASALCASIFMLCFALIPIYFGIQARLLGIMVPADASPLIPTIKYLTNDIVVVFALCGIIAAVCSTADSLLCAISSNVAQDFNFTARGIVSSLQLSRTITLIVGVSALVISYFVPQNIISIIIGSYEISVCCLLIPLLVSYYYEKLNQNSAWGAVIGGLIGFAIGRIFPVYIPKELLALLLSALGYLIGGTFLQRDQQ